MICLVLRESHEADAKDISFLFLESMMSGRETAAVCMYLSAVVPPAAVVSSAMPAKSKVTNMRQVAKPRVPEAMPGKNKVANMRLIAKPRVFEAMPATSGVTNSRYVLYA